jgi:hypothetical protein
MTAAAMPARPVRAPGLPSAAALALARAPRGELERAMLRGAAPELAGLVGWEFRGINATPDGAPPLARLAGIQSRRPTSVSASCAPGARPRAPPGGRRCG